MSSERKPADVDPEQENSRLAEGLKSCRAVVNSYRALIANDAEPTEALQVIGEKLSGESGIASA